MKTFKILSALIFLCPLELIAYDDISEEEDLLALFGDEEIISIATGIAQPISKAPAVASVITQEQIKRIGAVDIDEILETIPGLHVSRDPNGYNPLYIFRGVNASYNPQVLMLVNGVPLTNLFQGDRNLAWGGMPVEAISRIEVIRGPGSAVYGADAFAGVINIVTKSSSEVNGVSMGVRAGSFSTKDFWIQAGGQKEDLDYMAIVEFHDTDGQDEVISADAQTFLDMVTVGQTAPVSNAPGSVNMTRKNLDARVELTYKYLKFRGGAQLRDDGGNGAGTALALDPQAKSSSDRWNFDITYDNPEVIKDMGLTVQLSYLDVSQEVDGNLVLYPEGSAGPFLDAFGNPLFGFFPDGVIGNPEVFERHTRLNISSSYSGIDKNELRYGVGYYSGDVYKTKESKNFGIDPSTGLFILPGSPVIDVSDTPLVFMEEDDRENYYIFLQDVVQISNDWELTAGIRYDDYSDFGSTVNPRLALVWSTAHNLTTKLLYGEAFRAPSFAQTRLINNPVALGNPSLDPEEMKSYELAFDYQAKHNLGVNLNFFYYKWDDIIQFVPDGLGNNIAQNAGEQTGYGMEFEAKWELDESFELLGNLAWQQSTDEELDADAANSPETQIYLQANWMPTENWLVNLQTNWVMDRNRMVGDSRPEVDDYVLVDMTVRRKELFPGLEIALLVKNLFDEDAREPSVNGAPVPALPNDLPLAGRSIFGEVRYQF